MDDDREVWGKDGAHVGGVWIVRFNMRGLDSVMFPASCPPARGLSWGKKPVGKQGCYIQRIGLRSGQRRRKVAGEVDTERGFKGIPRS